jgi:hypothetical protein
MTRLELAIGAVLVASVSGFGLLLFTLGDDEASERPSEVVVSAETRTHAARRPERSAEPVFDRRDREAEADPEASAERSAIDVEAEPPPEIRRSIAAARHFARHLADEAEDPAWADEAETMLRGKLGDGTFPGLTLVDLDCRSTLCRIDVEADDPTLAAQMFERLPLELSWQGNAMMGPDPDHRTTTVMYLSRPGMPLPMPT